MAGRRESFAERRGRRAAVDDPQVVLEAAARFLETRPRSVAEVRRRLTSAGYQPELVEGAIERLSELGMLDDEAFARAWVQSRDRAHPRGERAIREELRLKGVPREVIASVLAERGTGTLSEGAIGFAGIATPDDVAASDAGPVVSADRRAAERLIEKNRRALLRRADPRERRQRAYALLARNGFDPETCREVAASVASTDEVEP